MKWVEEESALPGLCRSQDTPGETPTRWLRRYCRDARRRFNSHLAIKTRCATALQYDGLRYQ